MNKWEKEFKDELYFKVGGDILTKNGEHIRYLLAEYLEGMSELKFEVKISARKGAILIERID